MAYSTTTDVQNAAGGLAMYNALADFDGDGTADPAVVAAAIAGADALIDSYLSKRFYVPIAAPPAAIVHLSARLAVFELRGQRQTMIAADLERNKIDLEWLEGVRDGANLPGVEPLPPRSSVQIDVAGQRDSTKNVSREKLKGFW